MKELRNELMTIDDVAVHTGLKKSYLYQLTCESKIPHYKPFGKKLFFKRSEIDEYIFSKKRKTIHEIEASAANLDFRN